MDEAIAIATGLPVKVAENPLTCVAMGAGLTLENPIYDGVLVDA
jgi:rod shape-determining protein MreB